MSYQWEKQPSEYLLIGVKMTKALSTGAALAASNANGSLTVTIYDEDETDVTSSMVEGSPSISGDTAQVMIKSGTDSGVYNVQFLVPISTGEVYEEDGTLIVVDRTS